MNFDYSNKFLPQKQISKAKTNKQEEKKTEEDSKKLLLNKANNVDSVEILHSIDDIDDGKNKNDEPVTVVGWILLGLGIGALVDLCIDGKFGWRNKDPQDPKPNDPPSDPPGDNNGGGTGSNDGPTDHHGNGDYVDNF